MEGATNSGCRSAVTMVVREKKVHESGVVVDGGVTM